jgi:hypothetical protein
MSLQKQSNGTIHAEVGLIDAETGKPLKLDVFISATEREVKKGMSVIQEGILRTAGKNYAKDGDRIIVIKEPTGFAFHFKQVAKPFSSGTVGGGILKICKWIEAHSTYKSNELFRIYLTRTDRLTMDFCAGVLGKMTMLLPDATFITMKNIPKPNRYSGNCYKNAWSEFKNTGNEPVIAMECCLGLSGCAIIVPHALNYNKETDTYYDTTSDSSMRVIDRMGWIIKRGKALMDWYAIWNDDWKKTEQFANTVGGYDLLWMDGKMITVHTLGIDCDRINEVKRLDYVLVEDLEPLALKGKEVEKALG